MSIRKKAERAVPVLLAQLHKAKEQALQGATIEDAGNALSLKFEDIERELNHMTDFFPKIKSWEKSVMEQFFVLEQQLDNDDLFNFKDPGMESSVLQKLDDIKGDIVKLRSLISTVDIRVTDKLRAMSFKPKDLPTEDDHHKVSQEWVDLGIDYKVLHSEPMSSLIASYHRLESSQVKMCLLCFSIFPKNIAIKKTPLIYWWIAEGIVTKAQDKTAEEVGELVLQELLSEGFIRPSDDGNKRQSVNSFVVCPLIHLMLIRLARENNFLTFGSQWELHSGKRIAFLWHGRKELYSMNYIAERQLEDLLMVFNLNEQYLGMTPEWLNKLKKVKVLQMGRWQNSVTHHIEVENKMLLNGLGSQKHLKYLSLRGISRVETLPPSISKLVSLQILDLRACHNLEKLPPGISELKNLTHLDVSECYLIESMPKGLDQLSNLQVLKGFVLGKAGRNSCKISDLAELKKLRKLSIRVGNQGETQKEDQLESLVSFSALRVLTILWGVVSFAPTTFLFLPERLTKLDLRCVPFDEVPEWLRPSSLPNLEKLYITGGKLKSLGRHIWKAKYIRLKYLENLEMDRENLVALFPDYRYLEKISRLHPDSNVTLYRAG